MSVLSLILALTAIYAGLYYYVHKKYAYWKYHNIAYVKPTFPFGTVTPIKQTMHMSEVFAKCYKENKHKNSPFIGLYIFLKPMVLASNLEFVKSILIEDFNYFTNRGMYYNERDDPISAHLFAIEDQKWRDLRIKLSPTFTTGKMKYMFSTIMAISEELKNCVDRELKASSVLEFKEIVGRFTTDVIGSCAFGIECNSLEIPDTEFRVMGRQAFEAKGWEKIKVLFMFANRELSKKLGIRFFRSEVSSFFLKMVRDTVDYRTVNKVERNDFMNLMLNLQKDNKKIDGHELTFEELAAQAFIFWFAGFETSSSAMSYALLELGYNHVIQDRARNEIRMVLQKHGGQFTYEAMIEMKYLEQVINESLRRCPPIAHLRRIASKDYREPQTGHIIRKNEFVIIPILGIHNDPEYFPNPDVFDPDRFTDEQIAKRNPFAFLPFGDGPRICIGLRFGMMQAKIGLATLLLNYKFSHAPQTQYPAKFTTDTITLSCADGQWLQVEKCL